MFKLPAPFTLLFLFLLITINANAQQWLWAQSASGQATVGEGIDVACDSKGNAVICGYFQNGEITFGNYTLSTTGFENACIAKYDAKGNVLWASTPVLDTPFTNYYDVVSNIVTDRNDDIFLSGTYNAPTITFGNFTLTNGGPFKIAPYLVKYSSNGTVLWANQGIGGDVIVTGLTTDKSNNVYLAGVFTNSMMLGAVTLTTDSLTYDGFLVKYGPSGNFIWAKDVKQGAEGFGLATDSMNNLYLCGQYYDSIRFDAYLLQDVGNANFFLTKVDSTGKTLWATDAQQSVFSGGARVSTDPAGNAIITGVYEGTIKVGNITLPKPAGTNVEDIFVIKYSPSGSFRWARSIDGGTPCKLSTNNTYHTFLSCGIAVDSTNLALPVVTIGSTTIKVPDINKDPMLVVNFDSLGNVVCAAVLGSGGDDANGVATDANGNAYVTGDYEDGTDTIGSFNLSSEAGEQIFLAKLNCETDEVNNVYPGVATLYVFPNPAADYAYINLPAGEGSTHYTIAVTDVTGRMVNAPYVQQSSCITFNLGTLAAGIYFIQLSTASKTQTVKVVKN